MKRFGFSSLLLFLLAGLSVLFMLTLNDITMEIHLKDLKSQLQQDNKKENNLNHTALIMNYKINQKLYEEGLSQEEANVQEARLNALLASEDLRDKTSIEKYQLLSRPVLSLVNLIRDFLNKPSITYKPENTLNNYLTLGYYFERNRLYPRALKIYQKALRMDGLPRRARAGIILHQGFCHAMLGEAKKANTKYQALINYYGDEPAVVTALVLLRYLKGFLGEIEKIKSKLKDGVEKSEKLYRLLAYKESLKVINKIKEKVTEKEKPKLLFLQARSLEELGKQSKAVKHYQEVVRLYPDTQFAKFSNSRIFIMGSRNVRGKTLKTLALKNNEVLEDEIFNQMVEETKKIEKSGQAKSQNKFLEKATLSHSKNQDALKNEENNYQTYLKQSEARAKAKKEGRFSLLPRVKIFTKQRNVFVGDLVKETKKYVILNTLLGQIKLKKREIKRMVRLKKLFEM